MQIKLATDQEKEAYNGVYPLHGWIAYQGKNLALEDLRGHWQKPDPVWEVVAPEGFHFGGNGSHSLLGGTQKDINERLQGEWLKPCDELCGCEYASQKGEGVKMEIPKSKLVKSQVKKFTRNDYRLDGGAGRAEVTIRYDDQCGNGHNSFSITIWEWRDHREWGGGAAHERIVELFPELEPFIKWHLCSSDGPMHYIANTTYHAKEEKAGLPASYKTGYKIGNSPITFTPSSNLQKLINEIGLDDFALWDQEIIPVYHKDRNTFSPKYTLATFSELEWHYCPFDSEKDAFEWIEAVQRCEIEEVKTPYTFTKGKTADIEAARSCAIWPDATLEQLRDEEQLKARLPALLNEFKKAVESLGMEY